MTCPGATKHEHVPIAANRRGDHSELNDNPFVEFYPSDHTNDTAVIRRNPHVVAINAALEIEISGRVVADSIGFRIYSGIGGQMDFVRGAALSPGGVPIIALPSTAAGGRVSRIVGTINPGAGVVTTRGHVHWVVTEYGAVDLFGKTLRERGSCSSALRIPTSGVSSATRSRPRVASCCLRSSGLTGLRGQFYARSVVS